MIIFKKILKWVFFIFVGLFILAEIIRLPFRLQEEKTAEQVAKIHATKLTLDDVMGKNLPPDPGAEADKTIAGIDANKNCIRDDVELAVFKAYPNSAKTRAVLLQYAIALQMEFTQPIVNKDTVTATVQEEDRAYICVISINDTNKLIDFVKQKQLNNNTRKDFRANYYEKVGSYESLDHKCDIDISTF